MDPLANTLLPKVSNSPRLNVGVLLGVAAQIPARLHSSMRVERVDAGLWSGRVKDELCFSILLRNRIVMGNDDGSVRISVRRHPEPEQSEINGKGEGCCREDEQKQSEKNLSKPLPEFRRCEGHSRRL